MKYLDFRLRIDTVSEGLYFLSVESEDGEASHPLRISLDDPALRSDLENARNVAATRSLVPRKQDATPARAVRKLGQRLFDAVLQDREVYACYRCRRQRADDERKGLRLHLQINAPELAALPWEILFDSRPEERGHLCLSAKTAVIRHLELQRPIEKLVVKPPIRILGMIGDRRGLDVNHEQRQMERAVEHLVDNGALALEWLAGHTRRDLLEAMRRGPWHVFHFIGHGGFDPDIGEGLILLEGASDAAGGDGRDGESPRHPLMARELANLLADHRSLRLVVLNSCEGARSSRSELFSSTASILAGRGVPAVVSMQNEITDTAAVGLSQALYKYLAEGMPVDAALSEARRAIWGAREATVEWATPVLHMRSRDGLLFPVGLFAEKPPPLADGPRTSPTAETRGDLSILRHRVEEYWIEGVLDKSTHHAARQELLLETPDAGSELLSSEQTRGRSLDQVLRKALEEVGGSLLILGEPGSGKTTLLLELARALLQAAGEDDRRPLPVVFNLSAWTGGGGSFRDWLAGELAAKYLIPRKVGRILLDERRILPLLDGLDEVGIQRHSGGVEDSVEQRSACVEAINGFAEETRVGFVACCRLREYLDLLPERLNVRGAIRLQPLSREKVVGLVDREGAELAALRDLLERDLGTRIEARSPLMLGLMMEAYRGCSKEDLPETGTAVARREHLMTAYVECRLAEGHRLDGERGARPYARDQTVAWLSWLARGMQKHGQTVFLLEHLQPSWLQSRWQLFVYVLGSRLVVSLIFGLAFGIVWLRKGSEFLIFGLTAGAIGGLCAGLIELDRLVSCYGWQRLEKAGVFPQVVVSLAVFTMAGSLGSYISYPLVELAQWADRPRFFAMLFSQLFGVYWGLRAHRRTLTADIYTSDVLTWSWKAAAKVALPGSVAVALVIAAFWQANIGWLMLVSGLIFFFVLLAAVFAGLQDRAKDMPSAPNQGIRLSMKNGFLAAIAGPLIALIELCFLIAIVKAQGETIDKERSLWFLLLLGLAVGIIAALRYGGLAIVQHYLLRFILYREGYIPWRYARFLDHAVELRFLQKVGGGYMFVHRYLLEHFAAMEKTAGSQRPGSARIG